MTNTGSWELNRMSGKNPTHTGGFLTGYDHRGFTADQVTAREGGQNAADAGRKVDGITTLVFRALSIQPKKKDEFLSFFGFQDLLKPRMSSWASKDRNSNFCESVQSFLDAGEISALLIRDYNTCGLGGRWDRFERGDHFARLVCALNLDDKADQDPESGGSFGLGKTTYANSSSIHTVIYHSVFEPTKETEGKKRRLMTTGVYPRHSFDGDEYGGFAYHGMSVGDGSDVVRPFEDEDAENIWKFIGDCCGQNLERSDDEKGTDILILLPTLDLAKLCEAVEDYYWPALVKGQLSVRFIDEDGDESLPNPLARDELKQFIRLFKSASAGEKKATDTLKIDKLRRFNTGSDKLGVGTIALQAAETTLSEHSYDNRVALMRSTGMVINYLKCGSDRFEPAVGVFIADPDVYPYLVASENAAHSEWSPESRGLKERFPQIGTQIVKRVNGSINNQSSSFQRDLQPDVSKSKTDSGLLSRLLSSALSGKKGDKGPEKGPNPVGVSLQQKERTGDHSVWRLRLHDNEYTPDNPFELTVQVSFSLAGDSKHVPIRRKVFSIKSKEGKLIAQSDRPVIKLDFEKGSNHEFLVEIQNPGDENYIVTCRCSAEIEYEAA